jgi:hypothetical protein
MAAFYTFVKTISDKVIFWIHGRRLGIFGDGQASNNSSLVLDGVVVGSSRTGAAPLLAIATGLSAAGAVTVTGTLVGDTVTVVLDMNAAPFVDVTSSFEATVSVAGQVQESASVSGHSCLFFINPQAAA